VYVYRLANDSERGVNEETGDRNDNVINRDPIKGRGISSTHTVGVVRQRVYTSVYHNITMQTRRCGNNNSNDSNNNNNDDGRR